MISLYEYFILFSDIMQYEADQNMVFNYLMVSGLAAATDMFEKNGTGMTGGENIRILKKYNMPFHAVF